MCSLTKGSRYHGIIVSPIDQAESRTGCADVLRKYQVTGVQRPRFYGQTGRYW